MNRNEKIKLLKDIQAGIVTIESIRGKQSFIFICKKPDIFFCNGKEYTKEEYLKKCATAQTAITIPDNGRNNLK